MFINGDGNWVNILSEAVTTYNNKIHSTIKMTPVAALVILIKLNAHLVLRILNQNFKSEIISR